MVFITTCPACGKNSWHKHLTSTDYTVSHETFDINSCSECNLLATSPRPAETDLSKYYQSSEYISHTDRASSLIDRIYLVARKFTLRWKFNLIRSHARENGSLLDYGCGTGDFLAHCKQHSWETTGVEPSPAARDIAARKSISIIHTDIDQVAAQYDAITLWHVLEHVPNPADLLRKLRSLLKKNGTLFIAVPNYQSYDGQYYKSYWAGYDVPRHLWHFNPESMKRLLTQHHFRLEKILPMKLDAFYVSLLSEKYRHNGVATGPSYVKAFITGLKSNLQARKTHNYSSLIYVIKNIHE